MRGSFREYGGNTPKECFIFFVVRHIFPVWAAPYPLKRLRMRNVLSSSTSQNQPSEHCRTEIGGTGRLVSLGVVALASSSPLANPTDNPLEEEDEELEGQRRERCRLAWDLLVPTSSKACPSDSKRGGSSLRARITSASIADRNASSGPWIIWHQGRPTTAI